MNSVLRYSFLALPLAFAGYPLYIFMPDLYATKHGLSLTLLGTLLLLLRGIDGFLDPLLGLYSAKMQKILKPLFYGATLILIFALGALFYPQANSVYWFFVFMLLATLATSFITINYYAFALKTGDEAQTKLTTSREAMSLCGILLALVSINLLPSQLFILLFAALVVSALLFFPFKNTTIQHVAIYSSFKLNGYTSLFLTYALSLFASSFPAVLIVFFVRDKLSLEAYLPLFLALYFLAGAVSMPLWNRLSRALPLHKLWGYAMLYAASVFFFAYFLDQSAFYGFCLICLLSGVALGADLALPPALLGEKLLANKNEHFASIYFAVLLFISKLALALASLIALSIIEVFGFKPMNQNSNTALHSLSFMYAALPALLKTLAALLALRRPL